MPLVRWEWRARRQFYKNTLTQYENTKLSASQLDELKEAFVIFDRDNDNKINMQELATVMRSIGFSPTQADLQAIQQEYGNRLLDIGEVQNVISRRAPPPETEDSVRDAFRIFDKDGTGYVSASELRHVLTHLGEKLSDEEVDEMIREADITGDGQVNYDHFVNILCSAR